MLFKNVILKSFLIGSLSFLSFHAIAEEGQRWHRYSKLYEAVEDDNVEKVKRLLSEGADIHKEDNLLYMACVHGNNEIVRMLLEAGLDPDEFENFGETALFAAVKRNHTDIVKQLVTSKANVNTKKRYSRTIPLHNAVELGYTEIVKILLDNGADLYINAENYDHLRSLFYAVTNEKVEKRKELVELLLKNGAGVNFIYNLPSDFADYFHINYTSILHIAIWDGETELVKLLLKERKFYGAIDLKLLDSDGLTALQLAKVMNRSECVALIEEEMEHQRLSVLDSSIF